MPPISARALPLLLLACVAPPPRSGAMVVVAEQTSTWVRNFNPLLATGGARWPTRAGIYEPLLTYNVADQRWEPWLATAWAWEGATGLRFTLREGVAWSDGAPFTSEDVVFTFQLLHDHPALDAAGFHDRLAAIEAPGPTEVVLRFSAPYTSGLGHVAHQPIVPAHIWREVAEPASWQNPDPVATGPFTEVRHFDAQSFELGRNPHYWQPGRPAVDALRFPALPSNEAVVLGLLHGEIDWAGVFVPAVDRVFVGRDPLHHRYWFPLNGTMVFLYPNNTRPPLDLLPVRQALSRAINRERLAAIAMHGTTEPADPSGLTELFTAWRAPSDPAATRHDPALAEALLDEAGCRRGPDGWRTRPDGAPWQPELMVVSGWSDWVRATSLMVDDLRAVGIDARMRAWDFGAWFDRLGRGTFDLSIGWSPEGTTPYALYSSLMSARSLRPIGTPAPQLWHRLGLAEADLLLDRFDQTTDETAQRAIMAELQRLFVEQIPAIPLFPGPSWGEANTARFTGFPSAEAPYARLSPGHHPDPLVVMTRVGPAEVTP